MVVASCVRAENTQADEVHANINSLALNRIDTHANPRHQLLHIPKYNIPIPPSLRFPSSDRFHSQRSPEFNERREAKQPEEKVREDEVEHPAPLVLHEVDRRRAEPLDAKGFPLGLS